MSMLSATGYVTGEPKEEEGDYGRYCDINLRFKFAHAKSPVNYLVARVYGARVKHVLDWIHDGSQITVHVVIKMVRQKERKLDGTTYLEFRGDCALFSYPPKTTDAAMMNKPRIGIPNTQPGETEDEIIPF